MKKINDYIKTNKKSIILFGVTLGLFVLISVLVITNKIDYFDSLIHSFILDIRNDVLTSVLKIITNLAGASFLLALSVILLIVIKNKKIPLYILVNLVCTSLINEIVKNIFMRSRPIGINLIDETGFSFPSGHSMVALSFYGFIMYLVLNNNGNKLTKTLFSIGGTILILLIGFSRIYLGVHYLSDVIAGVLLSMMYLTVFIKIIKLGKR